MTDENQQKEQQETKSVLQQTTEEIAKFQKIKEELKAEADRLEKLKADAMLAGTAGARPASLDENTQRKQRLMEAWKDSSISKAIERYG